MKSRKLIIRADGGSEIGMGHWSRCLFLFSCVKEGFEKHLFVANKTGIDSINDQEEIVIHVIGSEEEFLNQVSDRDVVVVDGYHFTAELFDHLQRSGAIVIYIDDLLRKDVRADIIINHSIGIKTSDYNDRSCCSILLLGGNYSLISDLFKPAIKNKLDRSNSVLLSMGGADPHNFTFNLINSQLEYFLSFVNVHVIVGSLYKYLDELLVFSKDHKQFKVHHGLNKRQISSLMQDCGTAVLSASTMAIEYAHVGGTLGLVKTAENQEHLFNGMLSKGLAFEFHQLLFLNSKDQKNFVYESALKKQKETFDGLSKSRFEKLFEDLKIHVLFKLREATFQDLEQTFKWASDKEIRKFSFSKDVITFEEHSNWFKKKLDSAVSLYFIAEVEKKPVGSIRFDIDGDEAVISYLVDAEYHGKGIGRIILLKAIKALREECKTINKVIGYVIPENHPSIKTFERLGFVKDKLGNERNVKSIKYWKWLRE